MGTILSINTGIGSSVGVFKDGRALFCVEEERFSRSKNSFGFPKKALQYILDKKIVSRENIDTITLANTFIVNKKVFYDWYDYSFETGKIYSNSAIKKHIRNLVIALRATKLYGSYSQMRYGKINSGLPRIKKILTDYGIDSTKVICVEHHTCHAASAYYGLAKEQSEKYLVFTLDGGGDSLTSTVSVGCNGKLERKSSSDCYSVGEMYSAVTYYLGFTPHEHEYKLMGLAPYVSPRYTEKYKNFFAQFLALKDDDTVFYNPKKLNHAIFFGELLQELPKSRFDNIAAGIQAFTEEITVRWIKGDIKKYGIHKILGAGGVFMNIKLNKLLSELPIVEYIDVFPSCGDESNIFGAAFHTHCNNSGWNKGLLDSYTLGTLPSDIETVIEQYRGKVTVEKLENPSEYIARQLAADNVVARCSGPMEFGARALGNRSILASPKNLSTVTRINQMVKKRDFWMPFAPAILSEKSETLINIPHSLKTQLSPYMMFAFDTIADKRDKIVCGIHQADYSARAETVSADLYPEFHDIISHFYELTGIPCVLNTSFNLHGYPIVENVSQALDVLLNSNIDILVVENYSFRRNGA